MADEDKKKPVKEIQEMKPKHQVDPALEEARRLHDEASKGWPQGRITIDLSKTPAERAAERAKEEPKEPQKEKPKSPTEIKKHEQKKEEGKKEPEGRGGK